MGMFDTIRFFGAPSLTCPAGHDVDELQTKDLECVMATYVVRDGRLFHVRHDDTETIEETPAGQVVVVSRRVAEAMSLTSAVDAYSHCDTCRPVLYLDGLRSAWGDSVSERFPWCEWRLVFSSGRLEQVEAERVETRDDVRRKLLAEGLEVLDDDERLARKHFQRREEKGSERSLF